MSMPTLLTKPLIALIIASLVSGCATPIPVKQVPSEKRPSTVVDELQRSWDEPPVTTEGHPMLVLITPYSVPKDVAERRVTLELHPGATVKDVVAILGRLGISVILADDQAGARSFYIPAFNGTLGSLLNAIQRATDVWFTWSDGVIFVSSTERVALTLPQEEKLATKVKEELDALGVKEANTSWSAGMVTMALKPSQLRKVRSYLERMTNNAALVSLQVAIVTVALNQTANQGFDWSRMQVAMGTDAYKAPNLNPFAGSNTGNGAGSGGTGTGTGGGTGNAPSITPNRHLQSLVLAGGAMRGAVAHGAFSFLGLYEFLNTYGVTDTKQSVLLKTVAGSEVKLESVTQIPYVADVGVTTAGSANNNGNLLGSARTEKANDGLTLVLTPSYDAAADSVTLAMDLTIEAVLGFNNLQAGNQLGQLSQPTTAKRSFNDIVRVRPGQTVVVGGLTYDQVTDDRNMPLFLRDASALEYKSLKVTRQALFIVVRPTVTRLGMVTESAPVDLLEQGKSAAAPRNADDRSLQALRDTVERALRERNRPDKPQKDAAADEYEPLPEPKE